MAAIFPCEKLGKEKKQKVLDLVDGVGRVDWVSLEKAFAAQSVELEDGRPSLLQHGDMQGLTRERLFKPGEKYAVDVNRNEDSEAQRRMQYPLALPEELRQIEAASFIIREERRDLVTNKIVKTNIGSGFFSTPRTAHTCVHNLEVQDENGVAAKPVTEGDPVSCVMLKEGGGKRFVVLRVAYLDRKLDYARLTSLRDQPSVPLHMADPAELVGAKVGLCTFHVGLEEDLEDFDMSLSAMPGQALRISKNKHHVMYDMDCWPGDSGSAVIVFKGKIVGMHKMGVNSLREDLTKTSVDERLVALEASVSTVLKSMGQGAIGLLASSFP